MCSATQRDFQAPGRSPVMSRHAMAATSHPLATSAALEILQAGGNAADAAVAAAAVLAVVEPQMTGIGGDCFIIATTASGHMTGFNGSGAAPATISPQALRDLGVEEIGSDSVHSVTVPGAVRAWETLLKTHGHRSFAQVFRRAVDYARTGFPVAPRVSADWHNAVPRLKMDPATRAAYLVNGAPPAAGDIMHLPHLAETLEAIAEGGADAFYTGAIAGDLIETLRTRGSFMTMDDLAACRTTTVHPVTRDYRGHTIAELPPNSQGIIALLMFGLLERFDMACLDPLGTRRFHLQMEAARIAYGVRDHFIADRAHMELGPESLLDPTYLDKLATLIDPETRHKALPAPTAPPQTDTVYLTVVDEDGLAVSFINSLFKSFGCAITAPRTGILLHNKGSSFRVASGHPNSIGGGKRPLHTILPAFALKDGTPWLSFGVMGGHYQPCGHVHLIGNILDHGMDIQGAIDCPRVFLNDTFESLVAERHVPEMTLDGLRSKGHAVSISPTPIGGAQAIMIDHKRHLLVGGSDPRKDGHAAGF